MKTYKPDDLVQIASVSGARDATVVEDMGEKLKVRFGRLGIRGQIYTVHKKRIRNSGAEDRRRDEQETRRAEINRRDRTDPVGSARAVAKARIEVNTSPKTRAVPKDPPARSELFLKFVRKLPCCVCNAPAPSDPHHWGGHRGIGQKTDDYRCVPLCRKCHDYYHSTGLVEGQDHETTRIFLLMRQVDVLVSYMKMVDVARRHPD